MAGQGDPTDGPACCGMTRSFGWGRILLDEPVYRWHLPPDRRPRSVFRLNWRAGPAATTHHTPFTTLHSPHSTETLRTALCGRITAS